MTTTLPRANLTALQFSPLDAVVHEAARKLLTLRMTNIRGIADKSDADALRSDLEVLWQIVDPVIQSIGEYASEHLGHISETDIKRNWTDALRGALEGNATFNLEQAGEQIEAERHADSRSDFEEHSTLNRAQQG